MMQKSRVNFSVKIGKIGLFTFIPKRIAISPFWF